MAYIYNTHYDAFIHIYIYNITCICNMVYGIWYVEYADLAKYLHVGLCRVDLISRYTHVTCKYLGMGQTQTTRKWTAGFGPCFHLPGFHL